MGRATHTHGPWHVSETSNWKVLDAKGRHVASALFDDPAFDEPNAKFIAAAPDVFDILEQLVMYYDGTAMHSEALAKINTAKEIIAKVNGIA